MADRQREVGPVQAFRVRRRLAEKRQRFEHRERRDDEQELRGRMPWPYSPYRSRLTATA